ncbi:hypothetical protein Ocin01_13624 [Orchesella cincta]|uniref:Uncharacterized protein n=1 Tax=Orchesella cincta TaxID=48709 RepID=A0A1D2MJ53_ORCCI|nr:hypothetical protein Ocin01_13624 [Orchesella cincta]
MKVYLLNTKFQKIDIRKQSCDDGTFLYSGNKYLDIHIQPPNSSDALTELSEKVKSGFRQLVGSEDKEHVFSNGKRNVEVTFCFHPGTGQENAVKIALKGTLLTFLLEEFKKKLKFKMQMVFASADLSAPIIINLELCSAISPNGGTNVLATSDNAWLINQIQTKDHVAAMFIVEANINQVDMSPLLEFRRSLKTTSDDEELTLLLENGVKICCNKAKLEAISPVISNWLQRWQSGEKNVLNLNKTSLSPEAVAAFEKFMMEPDAEKAVEDAVNEPNILMELLKFGDEYIMHPVVEMVKNIFMENLDQWDVDVALRLYLVLREISMEDLKAKAIQTIKANASQLKESQVFPKLLLNQELVTELFVLTLQL